VAGAAPGLPVTLQFHDGTASATIDGGAARVEAVPTPKPEKPKAEPKKPAKAPVQGSLF
jgi:hypothetical protein